MADYRSLDDATKAEWEAANRAHRARLSEQAAASMQKRKSGLGTWNALRVASRENAAPEPRLNVLAEAARVVSGDRQHSYGHPKENHQATADFFNAYLRRRYGADAPALDVRAVCMLNMLQKISRDANRPKRDNLVDIAGYARNIEMADEADE